MNTYQNYIAGRDVPAADGRTFTAFNPTTGARVGARFALAAATEVDQAVKAADTAFRSGPWGSLSPTRRGSPADEVGRENRRARRPNRRHRGPRRNGKLFAEDAGPQGAPSRSTGCITSAALADKIEGRGSFPLDRQSIFNYTLREPLGVVGVITPWNSPTFIAVMFAGAGARRRKHDRPENRRKITLGVLDRAGASGRRSRHPARCRQRG